jgi:hypothetical protein
MSRSTAVRQLAAVQDHAQAMAESEVLRLSMPDGKPDLVMRGVRKTDDNALNVGCTGAPEMRVTVRTAAAYAVLNTLDGSSHFALNTRAAMSCRHYNTGWF